MGALTPSEIEAALARGPTRSSSSPAPSAGPAICGPCATRSPTCPSCPVGGVDAPAARDYLDRGAIAVGVGSPLVGDAADGGDLEQLRARAAEFREAVAAGRGRDGIDLPKW